jgi:hypothetical protein
VSAVPKRPEPAISTNTQTSASDDSAQQIIAGLTRPSRTGERSSGEFRVIPPGLLSPVPTSFEPAIITNTQTPGCGTSDDDAQQIIADLTRPSAQSSLHRSLLARRSFTHRRTEFRSIQNEFLLVSCLLFRRRLEAAMIADTRTSGAGADDNAQQIIAGLTRPSRTAERSSGEFK